MKTLIKLFLALLIAAIVIVYVLLRSTPAPQREEIGTVTSDGHTWKIGAVEMDGTNVPAGQVTIRTLHATNHPPNR